MYSKNIKNIDLMIKTSLLPISHIEYFNSSTLEKKDKKSKNSILNEETRYTILNRYMNIDNLDEINLFWKLFYPEKKLKPYENRDIYCLNLLKKFSSIFLSDRDGRIVFKYWETEQNEYFKAYKGVDKALLWNSMNRYFATDILGVLYLIKNNMRNEKYLKGYYSRIALEDMQLESVLKKGIAETHLHVSASTDFYTSWKNLMNPYREEPSEIRYDQIIGQKEYPLKKFSKVAGVIRFIMAYFLRYYKNDMCFGCFLENIPFLRSEEDEKKSSEFYKTVELDRFIKSLAGKKEMHFKEFDKNDIENIFKILFEDVFDIDTNLNEDKKNREKDILDYVFFYKEDDFESYVNTYTENIFLMKAINYIYDKNEDDDFSNCFMNYLRIKNEFFSLMVQGNKIKGLDNFVGYFKRSTRIGRYQEPSISWKDKLNAQLKDKNLKKLEIRIGPSDAYNENGNLKRLENIEKDMCDNLLSLFESYRQIINEKHQYPNEDFNHVDKFDIPYLGVIYHFIKRPDIPVDEKCWLKYKCDTEREKLYYEKLKEGYRLQSKAILNIRRTIPGISKYIVGIDAASIENHTDPWVFAEIYDDLRDSRHSMYEDEMSGSVEPLNTLGFTFHAGEDFRHILTGLRRIDETIHRYKYHAGDRIGHGIALGIDVELWRKRHPVVTIPRMEFLENMIWIWGSCKNTNQFIDMGYLERKIMEHAKEIYINTQGITVYNLWEAYEGKFKDVKEMKKDFNIREYGEDCSQYELENMICCPNAEFEVGVWNKEKLVRANHCRKYLERMLEPIQVPVRKDTMYIIEEMQRLVRSKVSRKGIIVETNPTSNSSIGEIENIFNHYITRLNSIEDSDDMDSLMISINTDDPSVFNTNLSNEFAYIFYSLVEKGYSKEKILKWIDKIREYGMNSSFIRDRYESVGQTIKELDIIIAELKERVGRTI